MNLSISSTNFIFEQVALNFSTERFTNVFAEKNNKTLKETLEHSRYEKFKIHIEKHYSSYLNWPLGKFLLHLKLNNDTYYKNFLNKYGDLIYAEFSIASKVHLSKKGIYAYRVGDDLKYLGRCRDSMQKRVNQGYGKIHPKNCYLDGQATNCHLNALIASQSNISFWLYSLESDSEIEYLEKELIKIYKPAWNLQHV